MSQMLTTPATSALTIKRPVDSVANAKISLSLVREGAHKNKIKNYEGISIVTSDNLHDPQNIPFGCHRDGILAKCDLKM